MAPATFSHGMAGKASLPCSAEHPVTQLSQGTHSYISTTSNPPAPNFDLVRNEGSRRSWNRGFITIATDAWLSPHGLPPFTTIRMNSLALPESDDKQDNQAVATSSESTRSRVPVFLTDLSFARSLSRSIRNCEISWKSADLSADVLD